MIRRCILPSLHKKNSSLEQRFEKILIECGVEYEKQFVIENKVYDFYLPRLNMLVECDGIFWHPIEEELVRYEFQRENLINDRVKDELALKYGYKLYRMNENSSDKEIRSEIE